MEILSLRDLIQDEYGNYYIASSVSGNKLTLVNAFQLYSFNRILSHDFVEEINKQYNKSVAVGQFFGDMVKNRIETLKRDNVPGGIYTLEDVMNYYEVSIDVHYEREIGLNSRK